MESVGDVVIGNVVNEVVVVDAPPGIESQESHASASITASLAEDVPLWTEGPTQGPEGAGPLEAQEATPAEPAMAPATAQALASAPAQAPASAPASSGNSDLQNEADSRMVAEQGCNPEQSSRKARFGHFLTVIKQQPIFHLDWKGRQEGGEGAEEEPLEVYINRVHNYAQKVEEWTRDNIRTLASLIDKKDDDFDARIMVLHSLLEDQTVAVKNAMDRIRAAEREQTEMRSGLSDRIRQLEIRMAERFADMEVDLMRRVEVTADDTRAMVLKDCEE